MILDNAQSGIVQRASGLGGCLLVTGGPGTGKTTALVAAVAGLVSLGTPMDQIVVMAYARPAAQRLRRQVMAAVGVTQARPRITTVHGWCQALLETYAAPGVAKPRLLSAPEQEFRVRELLPGTKWPDDLGLATNVPAFAGQVRALLTRSRQLGLDPAGLAAAGAAAGRADWVAAASFFEQYLDVIDREEVLDYAELVHRSRLAMVADDVSAGVRAHTKAVFVDDFAECDESVVALLRDIWRAGVPVIAFGDPSTRILDFRGAWPGAISRFATEFAGALSPAPVIELTHRWRLASGAEAFMADTRGDEPALLAERLWLAHADGVAWEQMAVIGRADDAQLAGVAAGLVAAGVPVRLEGESLALADSPAVRLIMAGVQLVVDVAAGRATPEQWQNLLESPLAGQGATDAINKLAAGLDSATFSELAWGVWTLGSWPAELRAASLDRAEESLRADRDLDAVISLFDLAGGRPQITGAPGVAAIAELVGQQVVQRDRAREADDPVGVVSVLSAYRSKGRGWPVVAVCGAVEGAWPMRGSTWSLLEPDRLAADGALPVGTRGEMVAAGRRLFRLAVSRASSKLIVTGAPPDDGTPAQPSRFLREIGLEPKRWHFGEAHWSPRDLVGQLRAVAQSGDAAPSLADAAASLLGQLADLRRLDGKPLAPSADPSRWWFVGGLSGGGLDGGPVKLSASNVGQLLECPRRWFLQNRAGASPPMGDATWIGQLAHWLYQQCAVATPPGIEAELRGRFDETPLAEGWRAGARWQQLLDSLARFEAWRDNRPGRALQGVETSFTQQWETDAGPVEMRGRVDRLEVASDGQLVVIDFKTSANRKVANYYDQLGIYAVAAARGAFGAASGQAPPELVWPGIKNCPVDQAPAEVTDESTVLARVTQAAAIVSCGRFPATPGEACRGCSFMQGCPASVLAGVQ